MSENLTEGLTAEIKRVEAMVEEYRKPYLKGAGEFSAHLMEIDLKRARTSIADNDAVEMIRCYQKLKSWEL
jgi:hypothetical protein